MAIDIPDKILNKMLIIGTLIVGLSFWVSRQLSDVSQPLERLAKLRGISAGEIARIEIQTPDMTKEELLENKFVPDRIVKDSAIIAAILHAYRVAHPFRPGDGRWAGKWRVAIDFYLKNGSEYHSNAVHNDYSDLLFVASAQRQHASGTRDLLSTQELGAIIERVLSAKKQP